MVVLTECAEDYVKHALKQQNSSNKKEKKELQKIMDKSRKKYIDNYITGRQLPPLEKKRDVFGRTVFTKKSKATLKKAEEAFDKHMQSVVTQKNEEIAKKNCAFDTQDSCLNIGGLNNCRWEPIKKECIKVTKTENLPIPYKYFEDKGVYTPKQMRQHSKMGTGPDLKITKDQWEDLEMKKREMIDSRKKKAGKRRKTRKRRKRRTKKKRRRNKRKSKKNKRKSKRRR